MHPGGHTVPTTRVYQVIAHLARNYQPQFHDRLVETRKGAAFTYGSSPTNGTPASGEGGAVSYTHLTLPTSVTV